MNALDAYAAIAPHYDAYTDFPAYRRWVLGLERLARDHGLRGRRLLDAGCGTGKSFAPLLNAGYVVTGCDASQPMLDVAATRAPADATLLRADLAELPQIGRFDLVTCLNDVCNCLLDASALRAAIAGLAANLAAGGVLVFDANTTLTYRRAFATTHCREADERLFVWCGEADPQFAEGDLATARHDVFTRDGDVWRRTTTRHVQRHHPHALVRDAIADAGLDLVAWLGDADGVRDGAAPDPARHEKAIYVARRPQEG